MRRRLLHQGALLALAGLLSSCDGARYVVVLVDDPNGLTKAPQGEASALWCGWTPESLVEVPLGGKELPLTLGLEASDVSEGTVLVEARTAKGVVLARGAASLGASDENVRLRVDLAAPWAWRVEARSFEAPAEPFVNASALTAAPGSGDLFVADTPRHQILRVGPGSPSRVTRVAGTGEQGYSGDGADALLARLDSPRGVALDADENVLYVADTANHRIRRIDLASGIITTLAGNGEATFSEAGGLARAAALNEPAGLHLHAASGRWLFVADTGNHVVRAIELDAQPEPRISTVAGTPRRRGVDLEETGRERLALDALLNSPETIARCGSDLFIADTGNHAVRRVDAGGVITRVLGDGVAASSGEGSPSALFSVDTPRGLACGALGELFVASRTTLRVLTANDADVLDGQGLVATIRLAPAEGAEPACAANLDVWGLVSGGPGQLGALSGCLGSILDLQRTSVWSRE